MKIAILQDDFPPRHLGGAGAIAYTSAKELRKRGHEVLIITTERTSDLAGKGEYEGLSIRTIQSDYNFKYQAYISLWNRPVVQQVKTILTEFKPDVVHAHRVHGYLSYASLVVAKRLGARVILSCHDVMPFNYGKFVEYINPNDFSTFPTHNYRISWVRQLHDSTFRYNPFRNIVIRHILSRYVDHVLAVSLELKDALQTNGIQNVSVVHNGIDAKNWAVTDAEVHAFKSKYGIREKAVFFTGKPVGVKGGGKLVEAIAHLENRVPDVQLLLIGREDEQTERLLNQARVLQIDKRIINVGWLLGRDLQLAYASSALAVVPTLSFDSFPTVNLESMAAGKPVIATCFGGSREAVKDGVTGYIVNPFNVPALSERIAEFLLSPEKTLNFGNAGRERVAHEFTTEKQALEFEKYYQQ